MSDAARHPEDPADRTNWRRWEMDALADPQAAVRRHRASDTPAQAENALRIRAQVQARIEEEARQTAWNEGREQGLHDGHVEGHQAGLEAGLAQGREQGRACGYQDGLAQGLADGGAQARAIATRLDAMAGSCATALDTLQQEVGQALIHLATQVAQRILHAQLQAHPEHILALVEDVLQAAAGQDGTLALRLHPLDLALVREHLAGDADRASYQLVADEQISRGGCIAETPGGCIDATLETRWRRVTAALGQNPSET